MRQILSQRDGLSKSASIFSKVENQQTALIGVIGKIRIDVVTGGSHGAPSNKSRSAIPCAWEHRRKGIRNRSWWMAPWTQGCKRETQHPHCAHGHRSWHQLHGQFVGLQRGRQ